MCPETFHVLQIKGRVRWKAWVTRTFLQKLADENFNMKMEKKKLPGIWKHLEGHDEHVYMSSSSLFLSCETRWIIVIATAGQCVSTV